MKQETHYKMVLFSGSADDYFRFNTADPMFRWMKLNASGLDVEIQDVSDQYAALALARTTFPRNNPQFDKQ